MEDLNLLFEYYRKGDKMNDKEVSKNNEWVKFLNSEIKNSI